MLSLRISSALFLLVTFAALNCKHEDPLDLYNKQETKTRSELEILEKKIQQPASSGSEEIQLSVFHEKSFDHYRSTHEKVKSRSSEDRAPELTLHNTANPSTPLFQHPADRKIPYLQIGSGKISNETISGGNLYKIPEITNISHKTLLIKTTNPDPKHFLWKGTVFLTEDWKIYEIPFNLTVAITKHQSENFETSDFKFAVDTPDSLGLPKDRNYFLKLNFASPSDEEIYGFGLEYSTWNFKGHSFHSITSEGGVGRGTKPVTDFQNKYAKGMGGNNYTTYSPSPNFITSKNRGFYFDTTNMGFIDFSNPHIGSVLFWGARDAKTNQLSLSLSGSFFSGQDGLGLTTVLTSFTGRMKRLPIWVGEGAILGIEGGSAIVQDGYRNVTSWGVPLVGVWMQDWAGSKNYTEGTRCLWNWQLNYDQYPDWHKMTDDWKKDGVRPFVYLNPYFGNYTELGLRSDYFKFLDENKYFIQNSENETYQIPSGSINFAMVDLTNPKAYDWVVDLIQKNIVEEAGAAGWMHDFGEYTPLDAHVWDGSDQVAYHNKYSEDWARSAYDATKSREDLVWFMRAGSGNSPKYTRLQWMGDQNNNLDRYDGLHSALIGLLNSGITGWGMGHSDIGGYTTVNYPIQKILRTKIVLLRWIEMNAFSDCIFRTHPGQVPDQDVQVYQEEDLGKFFAKFTKIFAKLNPYRQKLMVEMEQNGWPLVRSLMLHYWNDPLARQVDDQFLLGSELLVAPILSEKSDTRTVYFPKGVWKNIFTGERFDYTAGGGHLKGAVGKVGSPLVFALEGGENYYYLSQIVHEYRFAPEVASKSGINNGSWLKRLIECIFHF